MLTVSGVGVHIRSDNAVNTSKNQHATNADYNTMSTHTAARCVSISKTQSFDNITAEIPSTILSYMSTAAAIRYITNIVQYKFYKNYICMPLCCLSAS